MTSDLLKTFIVLLLTLFTFQESFSSDQNLVLNSKETINIYPNPVTGQDFTLTSNKPIDKILLFNIVGQEVINLSCEQEKQKKIVLPDRVEKGMYLVKAFHPDKTVSILKIIVK